MAEIIKNKFLVTKYEDINKGLSAEERTVLMSLIDCVENYRHTQGKHRNDYYVVNQDEPYADVVLKIILRGEDAKDHIQIGMRQKLVARGTDSARVIRVIETSALKGVGTEADPLRLITQYWDFNGYLLAEKDGI